MISLIILGYYPCRFAGGLQGLGKKYSRPFAFWGTKCVQQFLWALQRFYKRQEEKFLDLIWPQVGEVHGLDQVKDGKRGILYTERKPLKLAASLKNNGPRI